MQSQIITANDHTYLTTIVEFQLAMALETEDLALDQKVLIRGVKEVLDNPARGKYFLILKEEKVLGMMLSISEWSDWRCKEVLWIHSVYILPEYRGKGLFKTLYLHIKEIVSQEDKYAGLRLYVDKSNLSAQKVYTSLGMNKEHYELYEWLK